LWQGVLILCVELSINKSFSSDEEILQIKESAEKNNLGIGISSKQRLIEIDTYKGVCFCTPKSGFREALENFLEEVLGKDYYFLYQIEYNRINVVLETTNSIEGKMNFDQLSRILKWDIK